VELIVCAFPATWEKKMRGRDDKIIQATQKELNLAVRPSTCSTVSHISYLSTNQLQNNEAEITRIINDMYDTPVQLSTSF
jgi:isopentenyldiphosphate isomerase